MPRIIMLLEEYDKLWLRPKELPLTGEGRSLAIIDQPLWLNPQYKERMGEIIGNPDNGWCMHGASVVSIAVGADIGVAPGAAVHYRTIETWNESTFFENHATALSDLRALVENGVPLDCVSTSHGWAPEGRWETWGLREDPEGAKKNNDLISWFEERNIPVFSANDKFMFLCDSNGCAGGFTKEHWEKRSATAVAIPVGDRLLACATPQQAKNMGSPTYRTQAGGTSWAVPFVAGLFLLARQADPSITRQEFEDTLLKTATPVSFNKEVCLKVANMESFCATMEPRMKRQCANRTTPRAPANALGLG